MSGERSHEEPAHEGPTPEEERERRFRRPRFRSASEGDGPADPDGDAAGLPPAKLSGDLPLVVQPLRDLADAFRENSETLRSLAEGQARLARRIDRSDRSEAVINSTKALNDTFRGVQRIQERLAGRLENERKRPWLLMVVALGATGLVVGGLLWYLLTWVDRRDRQASDRGAVAVREMLGAEQAENADLNAEVARLTGEAARSAARSRDLEATVRDLEARIADLTEENGNLRANGEEASRLRRENVELTTATARRVEEAERLRGDLADARTALAARDARIAELEKIASRGPGPAAGTTASPAGEDGSPEPAAPADGAPGTAPAPASVPPDAVTDAAAMDRLRNVLNGLLQDTRGGIGYRFEKVGAARGKSLYDVVVLNVNEQGKEMKRIEASELRITVRTADRQVELRFAGGHIVYYGIRAPFFGGTYPVTLYDVDPARWRNSGLTVIDVSR